MLFEGLFWILFYGLALPLPNLSGLNCLRPPYFSACLLASPMLPCLRSKFVTMFVLEAMLMQTYTDLNDLRHGEKSSD